MSKFNKVIAIDIHENVSLNGSKLVSSIATFFLWLFRMRLTGSIPDLNKAIIVAAPHRSNWDWIYAILCLWGCRLRINYLVKDSVFFWPLSILMKATGAIPVNRTASSNVTEQIIERFNEADNMFCAITPEGTRKNVEKWKTGFLHIAYKANLTVVQARIDMKNREIHIGPTAKITGDAGVDIANIRAYYETYL